MAADTPLPTASELEILSVIWDRGPSTVREVFRTLSKDRAIGYSTVLKFMQIMTEKGTLVRDEDVRPQVYRPARARQQTQANLAQDMIARAFGGLPASLVMQVLSDHPATTEERQQIRDLLDTLDAKKKGARRR